MKHLNLNIQHMAGEGVWGAMLCLTELLTVWRLPSSDICTSTWRKVQINMIMWHYNHVFLSPIRSFYHWQKLTLGYSLSLIEAGGCYFELSTIYQLVGCPMVTLACELPFNMIMSWSFSFKDSLIVQVTHLIISTKHMAGKGGAYFCDNCVYRLPCVDSCTQHD